jgi:hypothetical protein
MDLTFFAEIPAGRLSLSTLSTSRHPSSQVMSGFIFFKFFAYKSAALKISG